MTEKKTPANFPSQDQIKHLTENIDKFTAFTDYENVEQYFLDHPNAKYVTMCEVMDLEPLPDPVKMADEKAQEAFQSVTPREHRHLAIHALLCPNDGAVSFLVGQSTGGMTATKIESLENARKCITDALAEIDAAIEKYKADA